MCVYTDVPTFHICLYCHTSTLTHPHPCTCTTCTQHACKHKNTHTHAASAPVPGKSPTSSSLSLSSPLSTASTSALSWAEQGTYGCSRVDSGSFHTAPKQSTQGILKTRDSWIQIPMALRMWSQRSHPTARFVSNPVT